MMPEALSDRSKVVVASTIMLSFISVWRAAAIVLSDLASSAYYAGGIAENSVGKAAPWFILAIMLFGFAIRAIYVESCSMFVRGGVYKVVHEALGGTLAKVSVSALMFDYVLTGPISAVSAGLYLAGLINDMGGYLREPWYVPPQYFAAGFALLATIYFWRENTIGIHESSEKALHIIVVTTVMVVILIGWCLLTMFMIGFQPAPLPTKANLRYGPDALGWLEGTAAPNFLLIAWLIGLGHSLLAMSGFETLAQVYREIEAPKLKNLQRTSLVVIVYSLVFTTSVSFFAMMLIPDGVRGKYLDNLIGGLSIFLVGPMPLKLVFHAFVVLVGTLILAGAVNTAIIGSNGVLNRVAEDGVLPDWFRQPHPRYGTTSRLINLIVGLQIITIILSRGDVIILGEAYAFGVAWSFAMKALSVLVLRYKRPGQQAWKTPINFRIGKTEIPVGLMMITVALFSLALVNLLTKKTATIAGSLFTLVFFLVFSLTERHNRWKRRQTGEEEKFRLEEHGLSVGELHVRPGNVLVEVTHPDRLDHLKRVLDEINPEKQDVVAVVVHRLSPMASAEYALRPEQIFSDRENELLSKVVSVAEKAGKHIELVVVPAKDTCYALVRTAQQLQSSTIVVSRPPKISSEDLAREVGRAWEQLPEPRPALTLEIFSGNGERATCSLGPHPPRLWPADVELVHRLWKELSERSGFGARLHHRDVVSVALRRFEEQLHSAHAAQAVEDVRREIGAGEDKAG
jgi:amino acid transporter